MKIQNIPSIFQPNYKSDYPSYSAGKNMEEIFFNMFKKNHESIKTNMIYLPVFWTSYYNTHNYATNINDLYKWLGSLDKTKKYFTIVQYASGIYVKKFDLDIIVFSAGGGGLNIKGSACEKQLHYNGLKRFIFYGNKGNFDIPLLCLPLFPNLNIKKDIFCSFMGRYDTHPCRMKMRETLKNNTKFEFFNSVNFEKYKEIVNRSVFTLAPRGYGYTSFRIYEAILCESIPIYIWDDKKILPFNDTIKWEEFCIVIHINELENLLDILEKVDIKQMQSNLQKIKYNFTFEESYKYMCDKLI